MEQSFPVLQIKGSFRDSVWTPEFDMKYLKKADWHIGWSVVIIIIKSSIVGIFYVILRANRSGASPFFEKGQQNYARDEISVF